MIRRMQRTQNGRWVRAFMALLLVWGASASAIASVGCVLGVCQHGCPMAAAPKAAGPGDDAMNADHSCCESGKLGKGENQSMGSDAKSASECSCRIGQAQSPVLADHSALPAPPAAAALLPEPLPEIPPAPPAPARRILAFTDTSPPPIPWHPDFGRAPPTR